MGGALYWDRLLFCHLVSHPETYNGSEYLNICRVTDITRSVNSIHQVSVVRTPIVRKRSDANMRSYVTEILLSAIPLAFAVSF